MEHIKRLVKTVGGGRRRENTPAPPNLFAFSATQRSSEFFSEEIKVKSGQMAGVNKKLQSACGERAPVSWLTLTPPC